jgi:hypothetical protein
MICGTPNKKHEYVVLFFPKGRKSAVSVLTIFCQYRFLTRRRIYLQVETHLIDLSCTETAQQLRREILGYY